MGVFDKLKKVLFDEENIEVPISSEELPERENKSNTEVKENLTQVIDHSSEEEDTIKEVKVPEEKPVSDSRIKFPIDDFEDVEDIPSRSRVHDTYNDTTMYKKEDIVRPERKNDYSRDILSNSSRVSERMRDIQNLSVLDSKSNTKKDDVKDYKRIIETEVGSGKKPFQVSPVISPVFGILDKNYKPEEVTEKREMISKTNSGVKPRTFGPVSYNDNPLPNKQEKNKKNNKNTTLKEDLVELNSTVSEIIKDTIPPEIIKEEEDLDMPAFANNNVVDNDEDRVLVTENYDEITSGIENEYLGNNSIEDAFEPTSEFNKITEQDSNVTNDDDDIPTYESHVDEERNVDNENLEDTIETDLFHLIDSMYQSKEEDSEEEE